MGFAGLLNSAHISVQKQGGVNECNDIFCPPSQETLSSRRSWSTSSAVSCVKLSFWIILWVYHNAARFCSATQKHSARSASAFGCPGMDEGCAGWNAPEHCYHTEILRAVLVAGISFIYLPAPLKNVRLFVVLAVLVTKKQFHADCDKPEAIVLKDGLDLDFRGGETTGEF